MSPRLECLFALAFLTAGCDGGLRPFEAPDRVVALVIEPDSILLDRGEEWQFTAVGRTGRGTTRSVMPTWSAAGGAISPSGVFTADTVDGHAVINAVYVGEADTLHARAAVLVRRRRPGYYASPAGSSSADGSWRRPWDLATALAGGGGAIGAGDTLWLWGGTYQGAYRSTLEGASGRPVVVRPFPTERAVIDGARSEQETLIIDGAWTLYWGLELTNSITARTSRRPQAVWIRNASDVKLIDLIVHDVGMGVYTNSSARNIEIYGSLFYNNGWQTSSRSDGHGIYLKNDGPGTKVVRDNVLFNHYGLGIHAYTNAGSGQLRNLVIEGNVVFNSGSLSTYTSSNVLVGGDEPVVGAVVRDNLTYFSPASAHPTSASDTVASRMRRSSSRATMSSAAAASSKPDTGPTPPSPTIRSPDRTPWCAFTRTASRGTSGAGTGTIVIRRQRPGPTAAGCTTSAAFR